MARPQALTRACTCVGIPQGNRRIPGALDTDASSPRTCVLTVNRQAGRYSELWGSRVVTARVSQDIRRKSLPRGNGPAMGHTGRSESGVDPAAASDPSPSGSFHRTLASKVLSRLPVQAKPLVWAAVANSATRHSRCRRWCATGVRFYAPILTARHHPGFTWVRRSGPRRKKPVRHSAARVPRHVPMGAVRKRDAWHVAMVALAIGNAPRWRT